METILSQIFKAVGYLFMAAIIYFIWETAHEKAEKGNYKTVLLEGFLWCAGIALFASFLLGKPSCEDSEQDMYGTYCNEYANNAYVPSTEQRAAHFAYYMTLLYIPVIIGAIKK